VISVEPPILWQSGGAFVTVRGVGFGNGMRAYIGDGRAPIAAVNATTAILQAPPGTIGVRDFKLTRGGAVATLKNAFQYRGAGLSTPWQTKPMAAVRGEFPAVAAMQDGRVLIAGDAAI
jgi:hypothetical protein